ncbi:MAG: DoxX family protein [Rhizomicrobium sp.]
MTSTRAATGFGALVFGLGILAMGLVCLVWGKFDPSQAVPKDFPDRTALAYAAAVFMFVCGAATAWRRTATRGAIALAAYFAIVVAILMDGRGVIAHYKEYGSYDNEAEQLALAAAALIVYARSAAIDSALAQRLVRTGQIVFGICAVLFGGAHFFYLNLTVPLVPEWLPPNQMFWAYLCGVAHIAGGVAIITGVQARLAAILLTIMYALFTPLVHIPIVVADPHTYFNWTENALNIALTGAAWVVADSLARPWRAGFRFAAREGSAA